MKRKFTDYSNNVLKSLLIIILVISFQNCTNKEQKAELVLVNGHIISVDSSNTIYEAIAIAKDTIMALGKSEMLKSLISDSTKVIDLKGKTLIPGFIDSHAHLIGTGKAKINLDLKDAKNWDEVIYLVAKTANKRRKGEWIIGRGWHQEKWNPVPLNNVSGYPLHNKLSNATPDNPVILTHASGHAIFANKFAMDIAKVNMETKNPRGGEIIKDKKGEPIGVFMEAAENLIYDEYEKHLSSKSYSEQISNKKKVIKLAVEECLKNGITSFHDAGVSFKDIKVIKEMVDSNDIKIRLYEMILEDYSSLKDSIRDYQVVGYGSNHLTVQAIKLYMDGALGSRGAWLLSPYSDKKDQRGLNVTSLNQINKIAKLAADNDFQICTHAIGDKGNRVTLDIYESILKNKENNYNRRWRIEHAQHIAKNDIPRFSKLGVIASMQSIHCTSDAPFVKKRLGKYRAENGSYPWRSLIDSGAIICNGTDSPVEGLNPLHNIYSAITRKTKSGKLFYPEQKMTRLEALKSYTINGAYAAFEEDIKGSLEIGKLADLVVLSRDILTTSDENILNTNILMTIIGGEIVYEK